MFCEKCGSQVEPTDTFCSVCGNRLQKDNNFRNINDTSISMSTLALVFSFLIPFLGWVFGGIGLTRAARHNNKRSRTKSIIAIVIATVMVVINVLFYDQVMAILEGFLQV